MQVDGRWVSFAETGQSDLYGILPTGFHFECEVKRYGKVPTAKQLAFLLSVNGLGGAVAFWVDNIAVAARIMPYIIQGYRVRYRPRSCGFDLIEPK